MRLPKLAGKVALILAVGILSRSAWSRLDAAGALPAAHNTLLLGRCLVVHMVPASVQILCKVAGLWRRRGELLFVEDLAGIALGYLGVGLASGAAIVLIKERLGVALEAWAPATVAYVFFSFRGGNRPSRSSR